MKGAREAFLDNGFNDFISKPMELDQMDNVLRAWIPEDKQKAPSRPLGDLLKEPIPEDLQDLPGIDVARGMSYCGTGQVYRKTLFLFREQIHGRLRRIRQAMEENRLEDYVIEVHSLKSAARWIGAMDLGGPGRGPGDGPGGPRTPPPSPPAPPAFWRRAKPWGRPWPSCKKPEKNTPASCKLAGCLPFVTGFDISCCLSGPSCGSRG